jgi:hypothetical protein
LALSTTLQETQSFFSSLSFTSVSITDQNLSRLRRIQYCGHSSNSNNNNVNDNASVQKAKKELGLQELSVIIIGYRGNSEKIKKIKKEKLK